MRMLITAGPTWEPIDAVRYVGNRSSGKVGLALAEAAVERGHAVTMLLGPGVAAPPAGAVLMVARFESAADLQALLARHFPAHDLLLMAAAVADFRPRQVLAGKRARSGGGGGGGGGGGPWALELEATPDLVAGLAAARRPDQRVVAFALEESADLERRSRAKLAAKAVDALFANPLDTLGSAEIRGLWLRPGRAALHAGPMPKAQFARWLLDQVQSLWSG